MTKSASRVLIAGMFFVILALHANSLLADTVNGGTNNIDDKKARFTADGWWETIDDDGVAGLGGSDYEISVGGVGDKWKFFIEHITGAPHWTDTVAVGVRVALRGYHRDGPHDDDDDPNTLPKIQSPLKNLILDGDSHTFTKSKRVDHPAGTDKHKDTYGFSATINAYSGASNKLGGIWDIESHHEGKAKKPPGIPMDMGFGSGIPSGSTVIFNGGTGTLTLAVTGINILDAVGGQSGTVDPAYAGDPFLSGVFTVSDMHYLGMDGDGYYRFSGPEVIVTDPLSYFSFQAGFDEYLIETTVAGTAVSSFARMDSLSILDTGDLAVASPFLQHFVDLNVMGEGYSESEWLDMTGIILTFVTESDLAEATNGFTQSASMPATVTISSAQSIPAPVFSSGGVVALPLLLVAVVALIVLSRKPIRLANR